MTRATRLRSLGYCEAVADSTKKGCRRKARYLIGGGLFCWQHKASIEGEIARWGFRANARTLDTQTTERPNE